VLGVSRFTHRTFRDPARINIKCIGSRDWNLAGSIPMQVEEIVDVLVNKGHGPLCSVESV